MKSIEDNKLQIIEVPVILVLFKPRQWNNSWVSNFYDSQSVTSQQPGSTDELKLS